MGSVFRTGSDCRASSSDAQGVETGCSASKSRLWGNRLGLEDLWAMEQQKNEVQQLRGFKWSERSLAFGSCIEWETSRLYRSVVDVLADRRLVGAVQGLQDS